MATYYAIVEDEHFILKDVDTGQLEIYEEEGQAMANKRGGKVFSVEVKKTETVKKWCGARFHLPIHASNGDIYCELCGCKIDENGEEITEA